MNQDRLTQETVEDGSFFCFQGADFEVHPAKIIQYKVNNSQMAYPVQS